MVKVRVQVLSWFKKRTLMMVGNEKQKTCLLPHFPPVDNIHRQQHTDQANETQ